jgi:hypothetical protein
MQHLKRSFVMLKSEGKISKTPFNDVPPNFWPRINSEEPDPFTEAERDSIIEYFFKKYWGKWPHACVFVYMLFWGGMRPSELTGRRWKAVDL